MYKNHTYQPTTMNLYNGKFDFNQGLGVKFLYYFPFCSALLAEPLY